MGTRFFHYQDESCGGVGHGLIDVSQITWAMLMPDGSLELKIGDGNELWKIKPPFAEILFAGLSVD